MSLQKFLLRLQRDYFAAEGKKENTTEMARMIDIPQSTWHRLLTGSTQGPDWGTASKIADFFKISMDELRLCERKSASQCGDAAVVRADAVGGSGSVQSNELSVASYDPLQDLIADLPEDRQRVLRNLIVISQGMTHAQLTELMRRCEDLQSQNYEIVAEIARSNPSLLDEWLKKRRA